jgi:hypothetical protein
MAVSYYDNKILNTAWRRGAYLSVPVNYDLKLFITWTSRVENNFVDRKRSRL